MTNGQGQWINRPPLHHARAGLASATVAGSILAIGGFRPGEGTFSFVEARGTGGNGDWQDLPPMPTPRANLSAAELGGFVYALGGLDNGNAFLDVVERYDPQQQSWAVSPGLPEPLVGPGVVGFRGLLYVAGGEILPGGLGQVVDSVITYDPATEQWQPVAPMPTRRTRFRFVAARDHLFAVGGFRQGFQAVATVARYNPDSDTWDQVASMNEARGLPGAVVTSSGDRIVVVGGGETGHLTPNFRALHSTEIYSVDNDQWQLHAALLAHGRGSLVCELEGSGIVLAIGGAVTNGGVMPTDLVEALDVG